MKNNNTKQNPWEDQWSQTTHRVSGHLMQKLEGLQGNTEEA